MLRKTSLHFVAKGGTTFVLSRNMNNSLTTLVGESGGFVIPVEVDYSDRARLKQTLEKTFLSSGYPDTVIAWIHSHAAEAHFTIAKLLEEHGQPFDYYEIHGYTDRDIQQHYSSLKERFNSLVFTEYHLIQLGYEIEDGIRRWLTNEEISTGVIEAVEKAENVYIVGRAGARHS